MLKDVGNDIAKKNELVNTIAETLSKINKAEDFTKLQAYTQQCAAILKIDEEGLVTLVNKYKRDKIQKQEAKDAFKTSNTEEVQQDTNTYNEALFDNANIHEKNVIKVLLEYGLNPWQEGINVADYIFNELAAFDFEDKLLEKIYNEYKELYYAHTAPTTKTFLYHNDNAIREAIINITVSPYELSPKWDEKLQGMNIVNRDTSAQDVQLSLSYFKLKKIKQMFQQNQADLEKATTIEEQMKLIEVHKYLKEEERNITKMLGTVIIK
jgi:DNA primase